MSAEFHLSRDIRGERETRALWAAISTLATRQHGVVSRAQLYVLGVRSDVVDRLISMKRLHRLHRGVYAVGHRRLTPAGRYMAAVLSAGDGAVLSHELDGRAAHDSTPAFESDRARDAALQAALWGVVRVTATRLRSDQELLATELRILLA